MRAPSGDHFGDPLDFLELVNWRVVPAAMSAIRISVS